MTAFTDVTETTRELPRASGRTFSWRDLLYRWLDALPEQFPDPVQDPHADNERNTSLWYLLPPI